MMSAMQVLSQVIILGFFVLQLRGESCTTTDGNQICEVKAGESFEITCRDEVPVHWEYPRQEYSPVEYDYTSSGEHELSYQFPEESEVGESIYKEEDNDVVYYNAKLNAVNAVYKDTGFYKCIREGEKALVKEVYYFVRDEEKLLVEDVDPSLFYGFLTKPLTIPCKPTAPDVKVILKKESNEVQVGTSSDGRIVTYDPRIGFMISAAYVTDGGAYVCEAIREDKTMNVLYVVNIIDNLFV